jgi:hypothetical protein
MKRIVVVIAALLLFAGQSIAANGSEAGQASGATFEQRKAAVLDRIDQRMARLQEARACVSAATTPEALRTCMPRPAGPMGQGQGRQRTGQ